MTLKTNTGARYKMKVDSTKKVLSIDLYGFYSLDEANAFFVDYEKYIINT